MQIFPCCLPSDQCMASALPLDISILVMMDTNAVYSQLDRRPKSSNHLSKPRTKPNSAVHNLRTLSNIRSSAIQGHLQINFLINLDSKAPAAHMASQGLQVQFRAMAWASVHRQGIMARRQVKASRTNLHPATSVPINKCRSDLQATR